MNASTFPMADVGTNFVNWHNGTMAQIRKLIIGRDDTLELVLVTIYSNGHVLLEAVPGAGKTTIALTLQHAIADCNSIFTQMTADILPANLIGSWVYDEVKREMVVKHGPVSPWVNIFLADEANRTPARTFGALLSAMQERKVTIDGTVFKLNDPFCVIATQNPIEQQGVYPLAEAVTDRFAVKGVLGYNSRDDEITLLTNGHVFHGNAQERAGVTPAINIAQLRAMRDYVRDNVRLSPHVAAYIVDLVRATRPHCPDEFNAWMPEAHRKSISFGASFRGQQWLAATSKAVAAVAGRTQVTVTDVQKMAPYVLGHRLGFTPEAKMLGAARNATEVIKEMMSKVPTVGLVQ